MTDFILLLIVGACWTWGVFTLFHEGYILSRFADLFRADDPLDDENSPPQKIGTWFTKPLFDCPPCMSSVHGAIFGLFAFGFSWTVVPFMICLCGLNFILKSILFPEYE